MLSQLRNLVLRLEELETQLAQPETYADPARLSKLTKEQKDLTPVVDTYRRWQTALSDLVSMAFIAMYPVIIAVTIPKTRGKTSISAPVFIKSRPCTAAAPKITGILIRKVKFAFSSLESP